jgi:predicted MFS family arabinose efflux permease
MHRPDQIEDGYGAATGWTALLSGRNAIRTLTLAGGTALHATNVFIAATILPSVVSDIGGLPYYAWNTTIFMVMSILGSTLSTRLLLRAGPRAAYAIAAVLFALGTAVCAAAPSMPVFLIGRALQGLGGGLLLAFAYAMIRLVLPETLWPRAITMVSGMWGTATLVGPAIGGIFAELGVWRDAFWTLIPISLLFALLAAVVLPQNTTGRAAQTAVPVAQLMSLMTAVFALSAGSVADNPIWTAAGVATGLAFLAALAWAERRSTNRMLPADALRPFRRLFLLFTTIALLEFAVTSCEVFIPLFMQVLHGQKPLTAGYIGALLGVGWTIGSFTSSGASGRWVPGAMMMSPVLALAGIAGLAILVPSTDGGGWIRLAPISFALLCAGFGVGIGWPYFLTDILKTAVPEEQDLASAAMTSVQLLATAAGAAIAGLITNLAGLAHPGGLAGTAHAALWLFASFMAAPALAVLTTRRSLAGRPA